MKVPANELRRLSGSTTAVHLLHLQLPISTLSRGIESGNRLGSVTWICSHRVFPSPENRFPKRIGNKQKPFSLPERAHLNGAVEFRSIACEIYFSVVFMKDIKSVPTIPWFYKHQFLIF